MSEATREEICIVALAELFRGDGEILASAIGPMPSLGARLARRTFEPDLMMTDGVATLVDEEGNAEGWLPYSQIFDVVWSGTRHVVMGAAQIDRYGNQNIACIGDPRQPKVMLLGMRGSPGNTISHTTSYWVPKHTAKIFVEKVDAVSGIGYDRAAELGEVAARFHEIRRVVSNLGVFDFGGPNRSMRVCSLHPGVELEEVQRATGFEMAVPETIPQTRAPSAAELAIIREMKSK